MEHSLKAWPASFRDVRSGKKKFEVRIFDRDYAVGDTLRLREFDMSLLDDRQKRKLAAVIEKLESATADELLDLEDERQQYLANAYTGREVKVGVGYLYANTDEAPVHLAGYARGSKEPQQVVVMGIAILKEDQ